MQKSPTANPCAILALTAVVLGACDQPAGERYDPASALSESYAELTGDDPKAAKHRSINLNASPANAVSTSLLRASAHWTTDEQLLIVQNTGDSALVNANVTLDGQLLGKWQLPQGRYALNEMPSAALRSELVVDGSRGILKLSLAARETVVLAIGESLFRRALDAEHYMTDAAGSAVRGRLIYWRDQASEYLGPRRHVQIWLPPDYDSSQRRYPVIYMSDGENLFDPRIANTGVDWGVDEAMIDGTNAGRFDSAIVVSTWSTAQRRTEYSPWHDAPDYARFLLQELKPAIDQQFRTLKGPEHTFAMGSSMGGLLAFYLVKEHPDVFGACGCVSTAFLASERVLMNADALDEDSLDPTPYLIRDIQNGAKLPDDVRFFFDYGTEGLDAQYGDEYVALQNWLIGQGLVDGQDFRIVVYDGASHNEASWRARLDDHLVWLLGRN